MGFPEGKTFACETIDGDSPGGDLRVYGDMGHAILSAQYFRKL